MKFAWDTQLVDLSSRPVVDESGQAITLGKLVTQALITQESKDVDGAAKFARYRLASRIVDNDEIDVSDAALIKLVVGNVLTPLPVGRIWDLLDNPLPK